MAISTFISSASNGTSGASSITINKPTNTSDNDVMFAMIVVYGNVIITPPSGWTSITSNLSKFQCFYKVASSEGASYIFSQNGGNLYMGGYIATYRGNINLTTPIDSFSNGTRSENDYQTYAFGLSTKYNNETVLIFSSLFANTSAQTFFTPPSGWTERLDERIPNTGYGSHFLCDYEMISSGNISDKSVGITRLVDIKQSFMVALNPLEIPSSFIPKIMQR